jgi:hypothetical protein
MASVSDISIRPAQLSDREQLLRFREALWPNAPAEEHARELTLILEGKASATMPLIILVAEASDGVLAGFLEVDLPRRRLRPITPGGLYRGLVRC